MAALNTLINKPSGSLGSDFTHFSDKFSSLKSGYSDLRNEVSRVSKERVAYMVSWQKQIQKITNSDIQAAAKSNYANAQSDFSRFTQRANSTETSGGRLISYLDNMKKYLSTDLSSSGIQGASSLLGKANSRAAQFKHDLGKLGDDATRLSNDLKPMAGTSQ